MAEKKFYNKKEIDEMFTATKNKLIKQIKETVVVDTKNPVKPTVADKTLSIQIVRTEVK